ncbi:MAG: hypothetical protein ACJAXA_003314 [Candidatus Aldehydirespiratoraceae bacterium]|jgi:hypothetical protein
MIERVSSRWLGVIAVSAVAIPLLVAVVALAQRRWYPVLDLAMTEFRVRDVGTRQTPLIGLPGRIGALPDQGSHPGPLSFWSLAPGYRITGGSAWSLEAATVSVTMVWIGLGVWIGYRRLGGVGILLVAAIVAVLIRGFGLSVLTQPWNPYMPLMAWLVVLLAVWSVLCDDEWMLLPLLAAASFAAQTHIPYLLMAGSLGLLGFGWVAIRQRRMSRPLGATLATFTLLWLAPLVDQLRRDPGNIRRLLDHFGSPSEDPIGWVAGIRLMLRHLDVVGGFAKLATGSERFVQSGLNADGSIWTGLVLFALWVGAFVVAVRLGHIPLVRLHTVLAVVLVMTTVSMSRIFGNRWFYLTLWAWVTATLVIVAVAWTGVALLRHVRPTLHAAVSTNRIAWGLAGLTFITTTSMVVLAPSTDHPEEYLGDTVGELLGPTAAALDSNISYVIEWNDAYFLGSQAFGLLGELDRAGFDVGASEYFRVPSTDTRTKRPGEASEAIVFVTGDFIEAWRVDTRFREVAFAEPRTLAEQATYAKLREEVIADLLASGLDDLVDLVDTNLFKLNNDQRITSRSKDLASEMSDLGQPAAVFLGPPNTSLT